MFRIRSMLNLAITVIMVFMTALTAIFIYSSINLKDRIIIRIVQQTELLSELITRSVADLMSTGHSSGQYGMVLSYGNVIGVNEIAIYKLNGEEAFHMFPGFDDEPRKIEPGEKDSFKASIAAMNSTGFFDHNEKTYSRYVPLRTDSACLSCHMKEGEILGILKIRLSTEADFEILNYARNLIWKLGLIACLPVGALLVAGFIIREKNKIYAQLNESTANLRTTYNELNDTKFYLQMILDNSRVLIITTDTKGRIVEFNREAEQLLGYPKDEVVGRDVLMLYENAQLRSELMNEGLPIDKGVWEVRNRDVRLKAKSGKIFHITLTLSTMVNDEGRIIGTVGIGKDVSEYKMLQFKLMQSDKLAGIGTLASGIAHEINNPLAGILGMAEAIRDEDDMELIKSHTKDIIQYSVHARNIVRELSEYSRSAANESQGIINLSSVIDNSLKMAKHSADFTDVNVVSFLNGDCYVNGNYVEMQQVFVNLIVNAVHAMNDKGSLTLKCWREGKFIKAMVADTGHGISEKDLSQIFDPFFTTKPVGKGTGLGLYVVYRIVTKCGGAIDVESKAGVGTSFTLKFPHIEVPDEDKIRLFKESGVQA